MKAAIQPVLALIVHSEDTSGSWPPTGGTKVLSLHGIKHGKSGPMLDSGRLLSVGEAKTFGAILVSPEQAGVFDRIELLPEHLLRQTPTSLTWYRPASRGTHYWRTAKGREVLEAVLPGLVFHVEEGVLHVAAFAGQARPNLHSPLYHAPLGNVYADTRICTGNAILPRDMEPATSRAWERVLLDTNYTHVNHEHTLASRATTDELIRFWRKRKRYATPPDARLLANLNMTLHGWLTRIGEIAA